MTPNLPNGVLTKAEPVAASSSASPTTTVRHRQTPTAQESLGLPAGNALLLPFVIASALTTMLLAGLTIGPYQWEKNHPPAEKAGKPGTPDKPEANLTGHPPEAPPSTPGKSGSPKDAPGQPSPAGKAALPKKLAENEKRDAPKNVNPLDNKEDDITKEIGK